MACAASLAELQAEASCPLCLDFLKDPVTTDCGHNFCGSCIHQRWEGLEDILPCPVCLYHCPSRDLTRNTHRDLSRSTQLSHLTEIIKQLPTKRGKRRRQEEKPLCAQHSQPLNLFCEEDLELLCPRCSVSSDHKGHLLVPIEEAAASHRRKLRKYLWSLKKQKEDAQMGLEAQFSKSFELSRKVHEQKEELHSEYEKFEQILNKEQEAALLDLLIEEKYVEEKLKENINLLSQHMSTLKRLQREITEKCLQSPVELLTGIGSVHDTWETLTTPSLLSQEQRKESYHVPALYLGLPKLVRTFKVDLALDLETAHPNLMVSEDRKSVTYVRTQHNLPDNPKRLTHYPAVLGATGFDAGRHFWQVEVRSTGNWAVGVCKDSFPRKALTSASPKDGCWQIQHWISRWDTGRLLQVGIFLDYEQGELSFYNMDRRSHIYTFTDTFTEKLWPYFSIGSTTNSLTISTITDEW
ncbi:Tripartite motif-containing protein 60 [Tupaia chinensis]|uniref:Tripartite motif-containing protein 60 n=1 Tax=Tupaia chinensis TaxID=246437 RepID=L9JQY6_TUPCH|nr:Tripartite motif-containing protein 60 [Tupaia chinensis]